jgi:serine/threonine-protein kinase
LGGADDPEALGRVGALLNDKWTLERVLGVGGMGAVYAARHRNGARAAVKVLHPELARNKEVRERFLREGYAANKVAHPGVVKVLDDDVVSAGAEAGSAYLVMELLEGESLQDRLERGEPVGEREFLEIADGVLEVLQAAHEGGVVHRDLKPENLFFAREGADKTRIKVLDFGLARLQDAQSITTYGLALGTPSFMSPEQAAGKVDEIDGRTDLFSLAATGFRLRTGLRIHDAEDAVVLVRKMATVPAPPIRSVAPDVSEPFARVIDKGLQFKREDRYESAAAMREDFRRALAELRRRDAAPAPRAPVRSVAPASAQAPARAVAAEPTIEISERDLERPPPYGMDESIRIPKRRSILPWLLLLALGGIGGKLWFDHRRGVTQPAATGPTSSAPVVGPSATAAASTGAHGGPDAGAPRPRASASHRSTVMPTPTKPGAPGAR